MVAAVAADIRTYCTWHTEAMWKFGNCLVRRSTRSEDPECTPPRREHGRRTRRRGSCCCCCCSCRSPTRYTPSQPRERVANEVATTSRVGMWKNHQDGKFLPCWVDTAQNGPDIYTKAVSAPTMNRLGPLESTNYSPHKVRAFQSHHSHRLREAQKGDSL